MSENPGAMELQKDETSLPAELDQLARRYLDLVYASALRQMSGDASGAGDVTQSVMLIMIRKARARKLPKESVMAGWLLNVTRNVVMQLRRTAVRRAKHEQAARSADDPSTQRTVLESDLRSALDMAMLSLASVDREVVARRYLRGESLAEMATAVGISENTAGRRVARALEKLRKILTRRGVSAPLAALTAVLTIEAGIKASAACAAIPVAGSLPSQLAGKIIWKMAMGKCAATIAAAIVLLAMVSAVVVAVVELTGSTQPVVAATAPVQPDDIVPELPSPVTVKVTKVLDDPSKPLLKDLLDGLEASRRKLQTIHFVGIDFTQMYDREKGKWQEPRQMAGRAWAEAVPPRRARFEVDVATGAYGYVATWDGKSSRYLEEHGFSGSYAETRDSHFGVVGTPLLGFNFSMQIPWEFAYTLDNHGKPEKIFFDRDPLDPLVLAKMALSARRVVLAENQEAMELTVEIPPEIVNQTTTKKFWFDARRGYGLLAREDTDAMDHADAMNRRLWRRVTRRIDQMKEVAPGVFYPTKAFRYDYKEGDGVPPVPLDWEEFETTSVTANQPVPEGFFHIEFPHGITVKDFSFKSGTSIERIEK